MLDKLVFQYLLSHPAINGGDSSTQVRGAYGSMYQSVSLDLAINGEDCARPVFKGATNE